MKKQTILIGMMFLLGTIGLQAQDTIPNGSFENWNNSTTPEIWHTVNELLPPGSITCNKTSNSYDGSYALSMKTIDLGGMNVPAVVTLGTVGMGFTEGGIPFTGRPESLKGYFKHPSSGDFVMLIVQFYKQGIEMGSAYWETSDSIADFTMLVAPITFTTAENPDTMNITIVTDQYTVGSSMVIDALQFEYPPVNVEEVLQNSIHVYPNPCSNFISVKTEKSMNSIQIINMAGKSVLYKEKVSQLEKLDLRNLPDGLYVLEIYIDNKFHHKKIVKK